MPHELAICQVKAFGDLVIACAVLDQAAPAHRERLILLVGDHLAELAAALEPAVAVLVVPTGEPGVPAVFDARKAGWQRALTSAFTLRRAVARSSLPRHVPLLFDQVSLRERWISGSHVAIAAARGADNIYSGWRAGLESRGVTFSPVADRAGEAAHAVAICPGSRIAAKNLPMALVAGLVDTLVERGMAPRLVLLAGERPDLEASALPKEIVPRSFAAMIAAVRRADAVIGADSMPAHIAERFGRPVYVFSPQPNLYWLPQSAFERNNWALIGNGVASGHLIRFLDQLETSPLTSERTSAKGPRTPDHGPLDFGSENGR